MVPVPHSTLLRKEELITKEMVMEYASICITFAKELHENCIETSFTLGASCFPDTKGRAEQYRAMICVCIISTQVQSALYLPFQKCMTTWIHQAHMHTVPCQVAVWHNSELAHSSQHHVLHGVAHISRC